MHYNLKQVNSTVEPTYFKEQKKVPGLYVEVYIFLAVFAPIFTSTIPSTRRQRGERDEDTVRELGLMSTVQKEKTAVQGSLCPSSLCEMKYNHVECF